MNSPFKFLRRVRIHGGECGAVARALHHEAQKVALTRNEQTLISDEKAFLRQADLKKSFGSTFIERKQMSTKTSIKRIALVAVSALGFGLLSVAPSFAAAEAADIDAAATTIVKPSARTGVAADFTTAFTHNGAGVATEVYTFKASLVSRPATSTAFPTLTFSTHSDTTNVVTGDLVATVGTASTAAKLVYTVGTNGDYADNEILTLASTFTPDVAGTYELITWFDVDDDGVLDTGETYATKSIAVVAGSDAVTATITQYNSTAATGATGNGSLVKVEIKNSGAAAASLGTLETITATVDNGVVYKINDSTTDANAATVTLNRSSFNKDGRAWLNLTYGSAGTQVLTVAGSTGAAVTGINLTKSTTFAAAAADISALVSTTNTTGVYVATANVYDTTAGAWHTDYTKSTTVAFSAAATTADVVAIVVTDVTGDITGLANADYTTYATAASSKVTFSRSFAPSAVDDNFTVAFGTDALNTITVTGKAATVSAAGDSTIDGAATLRAVNGSAITVSAVWKNQFGIAAPNQAVASSISGRNAHIATANAVTNADGRATFTYTDAPLAGVTATADTITMDGPTSANETFTVNWVASLGVSTVTLTGGNTSAGVTSATVTVKDIDAGIDGASTTTHSFAATVKDANGSIIVGAPVTFTITGPGTDVLSTYKTVNTSTSGVATSYVYGWVAGTYTVTATAGGVSGTGTITFGQVGTGDERTISATVSGSIVTAKVVDRFGNPVSGVNVYATKTGAGYFGAGTTKATTTTNAAGEAEFVIAGGAATVSVSTINYDSVAGTYGSGQTSAPKGYVANSSSATTLATYAFTAYAAGTSTLAEDGVGASFDAAGVATATASVVADTSALDAANAASDAAAEAIDAANAATDAANLAAEAADAATVAAEEARDAADAATAAVEELATQVATLMAALKAQITTLANTVAKIAKKVKA